MGYRRYLFAHTGEIGQEFDYLVLDESGIYIKDD
jgi:hypothetical protein